MTRAGSSDRPGLLQERDEELGQVEDALDVEGEHPLEGRLVEVGQRRAPGGAGVVDQDVERVHARRHLVGQAAALGLRGEVGRDPDAGALLRELGGHLCARRRPCATRCTPWPRRRRSPRRSSCRCPGVPAGDEGRLAGDGEEVGGGHRPIVPARASRRGQCQRAAHQDAGPDPQRLVLDEEGRAVVHAARAVRRAAADEEVAARQVAQELADVVARRRRAACGRPGRARARRWPPPPPGRSASASLTTARVCSGTSSSTWTPWSSPTWSHRSRRRTSASSCWASVKVRSVPVTRAEVGTTLTAVPAWIVPALHTQSVSS